MSYAEQAERIKTLAESLSADRAERERLKKVSDESLAGFHRAVREFIGDRRAAEHPRRQHRR